MQRGLPLSFLKLNLPARPQRTAGGMQVAPRELGSTARNLTREGSQWGCTGLQVLPVPETVAKLHFLKSSALLGETQAWEIPI